MKPIRLISGFFTVGLWTMLSRILGFAREILILGLVGPGPVMDAFVAAFRLPNMFRRLFAEGAFNAAFVPMFSKKLEGGENPEVFAREAFNALGMAVLALTGVAMLAMPALIWATAEGFYGTERFDLAVGYGRIAFPYILFISLAAMFSGMLNASGHFAAAAAAPVLLNICVISAMTVGALLGGEVVAWLIWSVPVAGALQLALVWIAAKRAGFSVWPGRPRLTPDIRRLLIIALPAALSGGVLQINQLVGQIVASQFPNAVSWLFAADRLYQLPLGVVGIAVGIVLLPDLSRRLKAGDEDGARHALSRAGEVSLALTIPSAVALVVIPLPLVSVLFERGAMTGADSAAMAVAVAVYGLGLPAFVLQKVLQPLYYAREDTRSPFRYALWAMALNAVIAVGLAPIIGWIAPAVATSLAGWAMVILLARGARPLGEVARFDSRFRHRLPRITAASLLMGAALWAFGLVLEPALITPGWRYLALLALVLAGMLTYFASGHLIGAFRLSDFRKSVRRTQ